MFQINALGIKRYYVSMKSFKIHENPRKFYLCDMAVEINTKPILTQHNNVIFVYLHFIHTFIPAMKIDRLMWIKLKHEFWEKKSIITSHTLWCLINGGGVNSIEIEYLERSIKKACPDRIILWQLPPGLLCLRLTY